MCPRRSVVGTSPYTCLTIGRSGEVVLSCCFSFLSSTDAHLGWLMLGCISGSWIGIGFLQFYVDTVKQMALLQMVPGSPLRTLCLLIAGQPAEVFSADTSPASAPVTTIMSQRPAQVCLGGYPIFSWS